MEDYDEDRLEALGAVVEEERGSLPYALIHGEALIAAAAWALGDSGVMSIDLGTEWAGLVDSEEPVVLHDPLCPMTPASFIGECLAEAVRLDQVVIAVRPVTDTVKVVEGGFVGTTVDRSTLRTVCSPIVLPAAVVAALPGLPSLDFAELATALEAAFPVTYVEAPPEGRRISSPDDIAALEALTGS